MSNASIKRFQSTALIVTATPKGSKGCLERRERATLIIQGQLRAFQEAVTMNHKTEVGLDHVLMGWMVRQCALVVTNFQVKETRRTPYRSMRCKYYTGEVVPFLCPFGWGETILRMEPSQHEMDARSFCRQA